MSPRASLLRPTWAEIDLDALKRNVRALKSRAFPAAYCSVVKADAYGHGVVPVCRAALAAGIDRFGVATVDEAVELREAGIDAPVVLLSEPVPDALDAAVEHGLEVTVYTDRTVEALDAVARSHGTVADCHLKVNTGMNRVGAQPEVLVALAKRLVSAEGLRLVATWSHLAVADEPDDPFTAEQARRFRSAIGALEAEGIDPGVRHLANSAGLLVDPEEYRWDMVRVGVAQYGVSPSPKVADRLDLDPVMSLHSRAGYVRRVDAGERISYGQRHEVTEPTWMAALPIGYADGLRRCLSGRLDVLVRGRRRPVVGTITMDQCIVDLGSEPIEEGEEVVLLGAQGDERITAQEWADVLGTIGYEITCGIGPRVPRVHMSGP